jgi:hypothetical protein
VDRFDCLAIDGDWLMAWRCGLIDGTMDGSAIDVVDQLMAQRLTWIDPWLGN